MSAYRTLLEKAYRKGSVDNWRKQGPYPWTSLCAMLAHSRYIINDKQFVVQKKGSWLILSPPDRSFLTVILHPTQICHVTKNFYSPPQSYWEQQEAAGHSGQEFRSWSQLLDVNPSWLFHLLAL